MTASDSCTSGGPNAFGTVMNTPKTVSAEPWNGTFAPFRGSDDLGGARCVPFVRQRHATGRPSRMKAKTIDLTTVIGSDGRSIAIARRVLATSHRQQLGIETTRTVQSISRLAIRRSPYQQGLNMTHTEVRDRIAAARTALGRATTERTRDQMARAGEPVMSTSISAISTRAAVWLIPGIVVNRSPAARKGSRASPRWLSGLRTAASGASIWVKCKLDQKAMMRGHTAMEHGEQLGTAGLSPPLNRTSLPSRALTQRGPVGDVEECVWHACQREGPGQ
jgi:hypothetical protein